MTKQKEQETVRKPGMSRGKEHIPPFSGRERIKAAAAAKNQQRSGVGAAQTPETIC